jgi:hypothetical protein
VGLAGAPQKGHPVRLHVELVNDDEHGELPASGRVAVEPRDIVAAQVDGLELRVVVPPERLALCPVPRPDAHHRLVVRLTLEEVSP